MLEGIARTVSLRTLLPLSVSDEGNHVPIRIADVKIRPAPRLFGRRLGELHATFFELLQQSLNIGDFNCGQDQGDLARGELREVRLADEAKMQAGFVARDRTVKRWSAIKEVNRNPQLLAKECGARRHVPNEQDRDDGFQTYAAH